MCIPLQVFIQFPITNILQKVSYSHVILFLFLLIIIYCHTWRNMRLISATNEQFLIFYLTLFCSNNCIFFNVLHYDNDYTDRSRVSMLYSTFSLEKKIPYLRLWLSLHILNLGLSVKKIFFRSASYSPTFFYLN